MSFGKARTPRFADPLHKVADVPGTALRSSISRTSLSSQRPYQSPRVPLPTPRSRSLNRGKPSCNSSTNISVASSNTDGKSKIPIHNSKTPTSPAKNVVAKGSVSAGERNKINSQSTPVPAIKSTPTTPTKENRIVKYPQSGIAGVKSNPTNATNASSDSPNSNKAAQTGLQKKRFGSSIKEAPSLTGNKDSTQPADTAVTSQITKNLTQKNSTQLEKFLKNVNLSCCGERKIFEKIPHPDEVSFDLDKFKDLLSIMPLDGLTFSSQIIENRRILLSNLINTCIDSTKDDVDNEKIAKYLDEGDGLHNKIETMKKSHSEICEKLFCMVKNLLSETLSLRNLSKDLECKLDLLETENTDICRQMNIFSEELENERGKVATLNQRKAQLEQMMKKSTQKLKELEDKTQVNDKKVSAQSAQIKSFESQLKQKDEKYHILEQKYNQQVKQYKTAVEMKDKIEKQQESFEERVNDLKKEKSSQQLEYKKAIESITNQLNDALKELEVIKTEKKDQEKDLKEAHERLMKIQEKSLEPPDATAIGKEAVGNEVNSLKTSEKEAHLSQKLKEVQVSLEKAKTEIQHFKEENDKLRATAFKSLEKTSETDKKNNESTAVDILKKELMNKETIIKKLQKQVDAYLHKLEERKHLIKDSMKSQNEKREEDDKIKNMETEMQRLNKLLEDAETQNKKLQHQLEEKQMEVEQRERVMQEQAKVLHVRDELLRLLRKKDKVKAGQVTFLQTKLEDQERNADLVSKFFTEKADQLQELYSTLEMRQRKVAKLEEEIKQYEEEQERGQRQRTRLESRIAELEVALHEKAGGSSLPASHHARCQNPDLSSAVKTLCDKNDFWRRDPPETLDYMYPLSGQANQSRYQLLKRNPYIYTPYTHYKREKNIPHPNIRERFRVLRQ